MVIALVGSQVIPIDTFLEGHKLDIPMVNSALVTDGLMGMVNCLLIEKSFQGLLLACCSHDD